MTDYSALAQRVSSSVTGVRGCLMLSRDGMVLGAHPEGDVEADLRAAWVRFAGVGDPERSYVVFPDQIWAFVQRGSYAGFAVAEAGVRPGVLVDLLEQVLMTGEQERLQDRQTMRVPEAPAAPSGKPRTSLHRPDRSGAVEPAGTLPEAASPPAPSGSRRPGETDPDPAAPVGTDTSRPAEPSTPPPIDPDRNEGPDRKEGKEGEPEVDRFLLAKEFAGLLQVPKDDDEAST
ncbi:MAG: hypothetical protein ACRDG8_08465 [Actinomycetota bacterium]